MLKALYYLANYILYKIFVRFHALGWRVAFSRGVLIKNARYISIGSRVYIGHGTLIQAPEEHLQYSKNKPKIVIGNRVTIGSGTVINGADSLVIEDNVLIGPFTYISDNSHAFKDTTKAVRFQGLDNVKPILIRNGAWIGNKVTINPGITIGKNSVVGANSVVTKDVPDFSVAVGLPARVIKTYDFDKKEWVSV